MLELLILPQEAPFPSEIQRTTSGKSQASQWHEVEFDIWESLILPQRDARSSKMPGLTIGSWSASQWHKWNLDVWESLILPHAEVRYGEILRVRLKSFCYYLTGIMNVLTCGSRWYHRLLKCDPVGYSQFHQFHHLRDLPLVSHWCDDRFDMRKSLVLPLAESWSRETLRFHLRDSFASHWYEDNADERTSLILQLAEAWSSEMLRFHLTDSFVSHW